MPRKFVAITQDDLRRKIESRWQGDQYQMVDDLGKDLKCKFDMENFEDAVEPGDPLLGLVGYVTLDNGLSICGMVAGGDWEFPVYFLVYWDGKKLRGYVPTEGNPWNTTIKMAYGNEDEADLKNARKRWPGRSIDENVIAELDFTFDGTAILTDILNHITER